MTESIVVATICAVIALIGAFGGAVSSRSITDDCKKLGAFHVGSTVYECKVREPKP